jgi:lysophospholipase L1-like esterase
VEINAWGERGGPPPRPGDRAFRALVVGGSGAECYYLDQAATWPGVVERILREPEHQAILGVPSAHVGCVARAIVPVELVAALLRTILPRYPRLDAVLIMAGAADVVSWLEQRMPPTIPAARITADKLFEQHCEAPFGWRPPETALWRLLAGLNRRFRRRVHVVRDAGGWLRRVRQMRAEATDRIDMVTDPAPMLDHFDRNLRTLVETARTKADRVIIVRQPWFAKPASPEEEAAMFWNFGLGRPYKELVTTYLSPRAVDALMRAMDARAHAVAQDLGVEEVDLMDALDPSSRTFYDELHFTPAGAEIVGRTVAETILRGQGSSMGAPPAPRTPPTPPPNPRDQRRG